MHCEVSVLRSSESRETELLIIGAGPAGLSTALHLLAEDPSWSQRMLVLEKDAHPRDKLCGGGVTLPGLKILLDLDFALPLPLPQAPVDNVLLSYGDEMIQVRGHPQFIVFNRSELDAYLAAKARERGLVIHEKEPVEDFAVDQAGVWVQTRRAVYRAQSIVGADGATGIVRRKMKNFSNHRRVARLLEVRTPAAESAPHFMARQARFDFNPTQEALQGYFWDFPSRVAGQTMYNRGVYDARLASRRPRANLVDTLHNGLRARGDSPQSIQLAGHPIPLFNPWAVFSMPRVLLVGDTAGVEPLFGEGIYPALAYGQLAAQEIRVAAAANDYQFMGYRKRVLASEVGRMLRFRWLVANVGYTLSGRRWFMRGLWKIGGLVARLLPTPEPLVAQE